MDVKIKDGDMLMDKTGNPVYTEGAEEMFQRALVCIKTKKGGFVYNKELGCSAVTALLCERDRENLKARLMEAVADIGTVDVFVESAEELIDGAVKACITLACGEEYLSTEVVFDGEL